MSMWVSSAPAALALCNRLGFPAVPALVRAHVKLRAHGMGAPASGSGSVQHCHGGRGAPGSAMLQDPDAPLHSILSQAAPEIGGQGLGKVAIQELEAWAAMQDDAGGAACSMSGSTQRHARAVPESRIKGIIESLMHQHLGLPVHLHAVAHAGTLLAVYHSGMGSAAGHDSAALLEAAAQHVQQAMHGVSGGPQFTWHSLLVCSHLRDKGRYRVELQVKPGGNLCMGAAVMHAEVQLLMALHAARAMVADAVVMARQTMEEQHAPPKPESSLSAAGLPWQPQPTPADANALPWAHALLQKNAWMPLQKAACTAMQQGRYLLNNTGLAEASVLHSDDLDVGMQRLQGLVSEANCMLSLQGRVRVDASSALSHIVASAVCCHIIPLVWSEHTNHV
jgi:hypothetical protein